MADTKKEDTTNNAEKTQSDAPSTSNDRSFETKDASSSMPGNAVTSSDFKSEDEQNTMGTPANTQTELRDEPEVSSAKKQIVSFVTGLLIGALLMSLFI